MTYRKFLILSSLAATLIFFASDFLTIRYLSDFNGRLAFCAIRIGMALDLIPFAATGFIVSPFSLGTTAKAIIATGFYLLYIAGIVYLLTRKYRLSSFSKPLALAGIKVRLIILFILMMLMGYGLDRLCTTVRI